MPKRYAVKLTAAELEAVAKALADRVYGAGDSGPLESALRHINNARPSGLKAALSRALASEAP